MRVHVQPMRSLHPLYGPGCMLPAALTWLTAVKLLLKGGAARTGFLASTHEMMSGQWSRLQASTTSSKATKMETMQQQEEGHSTTQNIHYPYI